MCAGDAEAGQRREGTWRADARRALAYFFREVGFGRREVGFEARSKTVVFGCRAAVARETYRPLTALRAFVELLFLDMQALRKQAEPA